MAAFSLLLVNHIYGDARSVWNRFFRDALATWFRTDWRAPAHLVGICIIALAGWAVWLAGDPKGILLTPVIGIFGWLLTAVLFAAGAATIKSARETQRLRRQWRHENSHEQLAKRRFEEATQKGRQKAAAIAAAEESRSKSKKLIPEIDEAIAYFSDWPRFALDQLRPHSGRLPQSPADLDAGLLSDWQMRFDVNFPRVEEMVAAPASEEPPLTDFSFREPHRLYDVLPPELIEANARAVRQQQQWGLEEYRRHVAWAHACAAMLRDRRSDLERQIAVADAELKRLK